MEEWEKLFQQRNNITYTASGHDGTAPIFKVLDVQGTEKVKPVFGLTEGINTNIDNSQNQIKQFKLPNGNTAFSMDKDYAMQNKYAMLDSKGNPVLTEEGYKAGFTGIDKDGNLIGTSEKSWFQQNKDGINTGIAAGQLGLGIAGFLENRKTAKAQRGMLEAQRSLLNEQLSEAKAEYSRVSNLRKKITASY